MRRVIWTLLCFTSINASAQFGLKEKGEGYYWTKEGKKVEGEFKISYKTNMVGGSIVKHYVNGKKVGRLNLNEIQSLILGGDSIIVATNFTLDRFASYATDIVRVEKVGKINLYLHCRKVKQSTGMNTIPMSYLEYDYLVKQEGSSTFHGIATKKQFEEYFIPMIKANKKLYNEIMGTTKGLWLDSLPFFVDEFNNS